MDTQEIFENNVDEIIKNARADKVTLRQLRERLEAQGYYVAFKQLFSCGRIVSVIDNYGQAVTRNV